MGGVQRQGPPLLTQEAGAAWLSQKVAEGTPFIAGKLGTAECDLITFYLSHRQSSMPDKLPYPSRILKNIFLNAGLFPATEATADAYALYMVTTVLPIIDGIAEWNPCTPLNENLILNHYAKLAVRFPARSLEPYYEARSENRWTLVATGGCDSSSSQPIVVVSPFTESIKAQWGRQDSVWSTGPRIWISDAMLETVRAGYSPSLAGLGSAAWPRGVQEGGWTTAIRWMADSVVAKGAKMAIVGCGALSLPLCAALKSRGISSIHTGGATQILFGIKGNRWETHSVISTFFNSAWVRPSAAEIPIHAEHVEGACYW
jgi:hypothetical protein